MKNIQKHTSLSHTPNTQTLINELVLDLLRHEGAITAKEYFQENREIHKDEYSAQEKKKI